MKKAVQARPVWVIVLIFSVFAALLLPSGIKMAYFNHLFAVESQSAQGSVIEKGTREVQGRNAHTAYWISYTYEAEGLRYRPQTDVTCATWSGLTSGDSIPVKYLVDRPGYSQIAFDAEERDRRSRLNLLLAYGSIFTLLLAGQIAYFIWNNNVLKRLVARGIPTQGLISSVAEEVRGRSKATAVHFSFSDNRGQTIKGRAWLTRDWKKSLWKAQPPDPRWQKGSQLPVYYDARNSSRFAVDFKTPANNG